MPKNANMMLNELQKTRDLFPHIGQQTKAMPVINAESLKELE